MALVRLDARLAVGIDPNQSPFNDRGQHQKLKQFTQCSLLNLRENNLCRPTQVFGIGPSRPLSCCLKDIRERLSRNFIELIIVKFPFGNSNRWQAGTLRPEVCEKFITTAFLMLLPPRMEIACVDNCEGCGPLPFFPRLSERSWSYQRPTASSLFPQVDNTRMEAPRRLSIR